MAVCLVLSAPVPLVMHLSLHFSRQNGDGGAIFTDSDEMAAYLESIRVHGKGSYKYENIRIGWNSRLDTLQAAIMLPKLKAFQEYELENVNLAAGIYTEQLKEKRLSFLKAICLAGLSIQFSLKMKRSVMDCRNT